MELLTGVVNRIRRLSLQASTTGDWSTVWKSLTAYFPLHFGMLWNARFSWRETEWVQSHFTTGVTIALFSLAPSLRHWPRILIGTAKWIVMRLLSTSATTMYQLPGAFTKVLPSCRQHTSLSYVKAGGRSGSRSAIGAWAR